jgi:proton-dependent oligopeptide transporter, POT family
MVDTPGAEAPSAPDITHVQPADKKTWFGHPRQLARLFSIEMWERFGFYGMRALLVLYLTKHFLIADYHANGLVGGYLSLVYLTPVIGGWLADYYLGSKRSVKWGALVMAVGYLLLCFGGQEAKPYATIDGQRYDVQVERSGSVLDTKETRQWVVADGQQLTIHGMPDGSVQLLAANGAVSKTITKDAFQPGAERSPFFLTLMLVALSLIVIGNGFFKPNISTIVGSLYARGDQRRDAGFTIFYMGINVGSIGSQILCPIFANWLGWWAGFGIVVIGMLIGYCLMQFDGGRLAGYGEPPQRTGPDRAFLIYVLSIVSVPLFWLIFRNVMNTPEAPEGSGVWGYIVATPFLGKVLFLTFLAAVIGIPIWSYKAGNRVEFQMMLAAIILVVFNVTFWTLFEQAASSLTLFADRNTDLTLHWSAPMLAFFRSHLPIYYLLTAALLVAIVIAIRRLLPEALGRPIAAFDNGVLGAAFIASTAVVWLFKDYIIGVPVWALSAPQTQNFNPITIVIFAPILSWLWIKLAKKGLEPSIQVKFGIALLLVGLGFVVLAWSTGTANADFRVALWWLVLTYFLHSIAELCISPVGLSMITKLSIARVVGMMMGVWFLSISIGEYLAGAAAQAASVQTVGGQVTNPQLALQTYSHTFMIGGESTMVAGVILLAISPWLRKIMHGVK